MRKNIIITGLPRVGKSTLLKKLILDTENKVGFVTNEVLEDGKRVGFEIETNTGEKIPLANINFNTDLKVARYFIDINNLNNIIPRISDFENDDLLFIDEIGQMQLFSEDFKNLVAKYFNSPNTCIATMSQAYSDNFLEKLKARNDIIIIELSEESRDLKEKFLTSLMRKISKAKRYILNPERFIINGNMAIATTDHGTRNLKKGDNGWVCDCDFCNETGICSHILALEELLNNK